MKRPFNAVTAGRSKVGLVTKVNTLKGLAVRWHVQSFGGNDF